MQYSFLQPLLQEDHAAHILGSLNKERIFSVLDAIVEKLGWQLVHVFECGNKMREYLATSLDGWIVMKYNDLSEDECSFNSDSEGGAYSMGHCNYNCGPEIKTPSSKKIIQETVKK